MLGQVLFQPELLSESSSQNTPREEEQRSPSPTPSSFQEMQKLSKILPQSVGVRLYSHFLSTKNSINLKSKQVALTFLRTFPSNKNNDTARGRSGFWSAGDDKRACLSHPKPHPGGPHDRVPPCQPDRWTQCNAGARALHGRCPTGSLNLEPLSCSGTHRRQGKTCSVRERAKERERERETETER